MQLFADNYFFEMAQVPVGVLQDACSKMEQMARSLDKSCVKLQEAYVLFCFFRSPRSLCLYGTWSEFYNFWCNIVCWTWCIDVVSVAVQNDLCLEFYVDVVSHICVQTSVEMASVLGSEFGPESRVLSPELFLRFVSRLQSRVLSSVQNWKYV